MLLYYKVLVSAIEDRELQNKQKMLLYDMVSTIEDRELQNTTENVIIWYGIHNRRQRVTKYNRKCYYMVRYPQ